MDMTFTLAKTVLENHRKIGLTVPKEVTAALESVSEIAEGVSKLRVSPDQVANAVAEAILQDRDPATDPTVIRLLHASQLVTDNIGQMEDLAKGRFLDTLRTHTLNLIDQWQTAYNKAAKVIERELPVLGNVNLITEADTILNRGGDIAAHFVAARDANATAELIRDTYFTYGNLTHQYQIDKQRKWNLAVIDGVSLDTWENLDLHERRTTWELAQLGLTLDFANPAEYRARLAAHDATRQARERQGLDAMTGRNPNLASMLGR